MTKNRDNLDSDLDRLQGYAQALARKYPEPPLFWQEFSGLAEEVLRNAARDDHDWVLQRIRCMVAEVGMGAPPAP
ncbi:hypothetical protein [Dyella japonica]|uniref:Uncharacterized protein n=1 Tax=Dyella japonica DSM 16301 TaxID=1440762 RepID=A0A0G9HB25_9GAMM|nr:hypothetical protein [Dyella japonica]KLD64887.1 hypothetical protein Y882_05560 [Dyella japonica DSM 16301]